MALAEKGWRQAMLDDSCLRDGLNIHDRQVTHPAVAQAFGMHHVAAIEVLSQPAASR
jgi:alanine dehydrogenase